MLILVSGWDHKNFHSFLLQLKQLRVSSQHLFKRKTQAFSSYDWVSGWILFLNTLQFGKINILITISRIWGKDISFYIVHITLRHLTPPPTPHPALMPLKDNKPQSKKTVHKEKQRNTLTHKPTENEYRYPSLDAEQGWDGFLSPKKPQNVSWRNQPQLQVGKAEWFRWVQ